jgi:hypothetical protein
MADEPDLVVQPLVWCGMSFKKTVEVQKGRVKRIAGV